MARRAFTLIELLVVVAIIAILVSILLPALGRARKQAQATVCSSHLYQIATAIYTYSTEWEGRCPYVETPMTNGRGGPPRGGQNIPGFGGEAWPNEDTDPFNALIWPVSLPNVLMPKYIGMERGLFSCPSAKFGWPRGSGTPEFSYRDAAANQPNGVVTDPKKDEYLRESFGIMDGRIIRKYKLELTGNVVIDAQRIGYSRATYVRDLITIESNQVLGPHNGGINVINRDLQVEFRSQKTTQEDLAPHFGGVRF